MYGRKHLKSEYYQKFKSRIIVIKNFFTEKLLYPFLVSITLQIASLYITNSFINPPIQPEFESTIIVNTGMVTNVQGNLQVDFTVDRIPWLIFQIESIGKTGDENLFFSIKLPDNIKIQKIDNDYDPPSLKKFVTKTENNENVFQEEFSNFSGESRVQYRIELNDFIKSTDNVKWYVSSKSRNWKKVKISLKNKTASYLFDSNVFAEEIDVSNKEKKVSSNELPKSGILIGGYDPVVMSNGLFVILQEKNVITKNEAYILKNIVESSTDGLLLSGVNILKFCEVVLNTLVSKNVITESRAKNIIEKSQKSEGILIGGYNVVVMQVEILNSLIENGRISLNEGQKIIDKSKSQTP